MKSALITVTLISVAIASVACYSASSKTASPPSTSGTAMIAAAATCTSARALPEVVPALASPEDCVEGFVRLRDQNIVIGTREGMIGLVRSGKLQEVPAVDAVGPVSDLITVPIVSPSTGSVDVIGELVLFAVDQGVGTFDPKSAALVRLDNRQFRERGSRIINDTSDWITESYYAKMSPQPGRPHLHQGPPGAPYALTKSDGTDEFFDVAISPGVLCGVYLESPGAVPDRAWCADATDLSPPLPSTGSATQQ